MTSNLKEAHCPICGLVRDVIEDLVMDHPWGWTGAAFIIGLLLGRKGPCCRKKKSS